MRVATTQDRLAYRSTCSVMAMPQKACIMHPLTYVDLRSTAPALVAAVAAFAVASAAPADDTTSEVYD